MLLASWSSLLRALLSVLIAVGFGAGALAQPPASIIPPAPQAPTIQLPSPLGARPGETIEIVLTGTNLQEPLALLGLPGRASFPTDQNNGNDPARLRVRLEVPADAPVGAYPLRLATRFGLSNVRPFCIDDLPAGPTAGAANRNKSTPMDLPIPCVASGRIDAETSEFFKISVAPGQRICLDVLARRLGSALDPMILIHDAKTGREIPSLYNDDAPGCQTDARLTHVFAEGGDFVIEIRDSTYRGGGDFWYRLRVGDFPLATTPMPLAVQRGTSASVTFAGSFLNDASPVPVAAPAELSIPALTVVPRGKSGQAGWPVSLLLSSFPELNEQEPNDEPAKAQRIELPCGISGRFETRSDHDCFTFTGKKGERVVIQSMTHELLSPADVYYVLKNKQGNQLAASDPASGKGIDFTAPEDGEYTVVVEHLNFLHGPSEVYRLVVTRPEPDFQLTLGTDHLEIPQNGTAALPIQTMTRQGVTGPIEVKIVGAHGLTGSVSIDAQAPLAPNLPIALLPVQHTGEPVLGTAKVEARAKVGDREIVRSADLSALVRQRWGDLPFPPREQFTTLDVATVAAPFRLTAQYAHDEAARGTPLNLTVTAERKEGFAEEITLAVVGLPPNVSAAVKPIAKETAKVEFAVTAAENAPVGVYPIAIIGKGKKENREFQVALPAALRVAPAPFTLALASPPTPMKPGDKVKVKALATRKGGFSGPIELEFKNLPAGVTAPKATIAAGMNEVELELTAAADAAPIEKADVSLEGKTGSQTALAGNIKVIVAKKE